MITADMNTADLLQRALQFDFLTKEEGVFLYKHASTAELSFVANELRKKLVPGPDGAPPVTAVDRLLDGMFPLSLLYRFQYL